MKAQILWSTWRAVGAAAAASGRALAWARGDQSDGTLEERLALAAGLAELPRGALWLHAASVGEVRALVPLARALQQRLPAAPQLITTSTVTGRQRAREDLGGAVRLAPLDAHPPLERFLDAVQPRLHLIVETEIWPTRLAALAARRVPVAIVSARLSVRRWPRYRRLAPLYRRALEPVALICPAAAADAERLIALGARPAALGPTGSLKWESAPPPPDAAAAAALRQQLGARASRRWIALGSVHPGEGLALLDALERELPGVLGIFLAPRHLDRYELELQHLSARGFPLHRASLGPAPESARVIVLDQLGLLPRVYALSVAAVMGGTFVPVGGHTPLEAASAGCPLIAGPSIDQQSDLCEPLREGGALVQVEDPTHAALQLRTWLLDERARQAAAAAGPREVARHRGIVAAIADAVCQLWTDE